MGNRALRKAAPIALVISVEDVSTDFAHDIYPYQLAKRIHHLKHVQYLVRTEADLDRLRKELPGRKAAVPTVSMAVVKENQAFAADDWGCKFVVSCTARQIHRVQAKEPLGPAFVGYKERSRCIAHTLPTGWVRVPVLREVDEDSKEAEAEKETDCGGVIESLNTLVRCDSNDDPKQVSPISPYLVAKKIKELFHGREWAKIGKQFRSMCLANQASECKCPPQTFHQHITNELDRARLYEHVYCAMHLLGESGTGVERKRLYARLPEKLHNKYVHVQSASELGDGFEYRRRTVLMILYVIALLALVSLS